MRREELSVSVYAIAVLEDAVTLSCECGRCVVNIAEKEQNKWDMEVLANILSMMVLNAH